MTAANVVPIRPAPDAPRADDGRGKAFLVGDGWRVLRQRETGKPDGFLLSVLVAPKVRKRTRLPPEFAAWKPKEQRMVASERAKDLRKEFAESIAPSGSEPDAITFHEFGERWARGDLAKEYPGHIGSKATAKADLQRLATIREIIGDVRLRDFRVEHAEKALRGLPARCKSNSTSRHYAQVIHRVLKLAVYPGKLLERNPLPPGFLPKIAPLKAKSVLYPEEEATLLSCASVPFARRFLYGFLSREGTRVSEAEGLQWSDFDLTNGAVNLDKNKTNDPRSWALGTDVVRALKQWRKEREAETETDLVFGGVGDLTRHAAEGLREDLALAGVTRAQLFERTEERLPLRIHDLRGTFVTHALATGRSEMWVMDRTGHKTSTMVLRYKRTARSAGELNLGWLKPLDGLLYPSPKGPPGPVPPTGGGNSGLHATDGATPPHEPSTGFLSVPMPARKVPVLKGLGGIEVNSKGPRLAFKSSASAIPPRGLVRKGTRNRPQTRSKSPRDARAHGNGSARDAVL